MDSSTLISSPWVISVLSFLMTHNREVSEELLLSIFRRINIKTNAAIDYEEFVAFLCLPQDKFTKILKQYPRKNVASHFTKKPIVKPVFQNIEKDRRSKSPLYKDQKYAVASSSRNVIRDSVGGRKNQPSPPQENIRSSQKSIHKRPEASKQKGIAAKKMSPSSNKVDSYSSRGFK